MVIVGATGVGEDEPDDPAVGRAGSPPPCTRLAGRDGGAGRCWSCWTARAAPTPAAKPTAPAACCYGAGARRVAIWPDEARLSLWDLPPGDLAVLLYQMIDTGTGAAAYYADIIQAVLTLAVTAPPRPAVQHGRRSWTGSTPTGCSTPGTTARHPARLSRPAPPPGTCRDIQLRYATLLGRLGPALDGPGTLAEADAWYFILEGTREPVRRRSPGHGPDRAGRPRRHQPWTASRGRSCWPPTTTPRSPRRVPLSNLYERGRSLGIGVQVSAQSWQGLGADRGRAVPDRGHRRRRHLRPAHPLPRAAGRSWPAPGGCWRPRTSSSAAPGGMRAPPGSSAPGPPTPDLVRRLDVGQACYIHRGAATFVQVARPRPVPAHPAARHPRHAAAGRRCPSRAANPRPRPVAARRPAWMTSSAPETPDEHRPEPVRGARPARPPDLTDEQVRAAWRADRRRHPPGPARRRRPRPLHRRLRRLRRAAHPLGPVRGLRRPGRAGRPPARRPGRRRPPTPIRRPPSRSIPSRRPRGTRSLALAVAPGPDPPRPPAAPGHPRHHRRRAVPDGAAADPRQPAAPADILGLILWFVLTGRKDLAPPPENRCLRRLEITYSSPACSDDIARAAWFRTAAKLIPVAEAISVSGRSAK